MLLRTFDRSSPYAVVYTTAEGMVMATQLEIAASKSNDSSGKYAISHYHPTQADRDDLYTLFELLVEAGIPATFDE